MYTVRQPPTGNLLDNWQLIKSKWSSSSMQQMYADDDDHILIFKKSSYFEVISYLHANTDIILIPIEGFLDIIGGVTEKVKRWSPNEITIITNFPLSFFSERISELP